MNNKEFPQAKVRANIGSGPKYDEIVWYHTLMGKTEKALIQKIQQLKQDVLPGLKEKYPGKQISFETNMLPPNPWCCGWFYHWTFRDEWKDFEEAEAAFVKYVDKYKNRQGSAFINDPDYICLMGAEDMWRWRGDAEDSESPFPCSCDKCVELNQYVIFH